MPIAFLYESHFHEDGTGPEELIEKADKMMYEMKKAHKGLANVR